MTEPPFDPYHKWLGIPPKDQPPDHYRLLGIERFESDADVISHAADARMAHIRTLATGSHARLSQELLNIVASARICLLNPQTKVKYDQALRQWLEQSQTAAAPAPPALRTDIVPPPPPPSGGGLARLLDRLPRWGWIATGLSAAMLLTACGVMIFSGRDASMAATNRVSDIRVIAVPAPEPAESPVEQSPAAKLSAANEDPVPAPAAADAVNVASPADNAANRPPAEDPAARAVRRAEAKERKKAALAAAAAPPKTAAVAPAAGTVPAMASAEVKKTLPPGPAANVPAPAAKAAVGKAPAEPKPVEKPAGKSPVPSEEELARLQGQLAEMYQPEEAGTTAKRTELAERLALAAGDRGKEAPWRFSLFRAAWRLAAAAGNVSRAMEIIQQATDDFELDPTPAKIEVLKGAEKLVRSGPEAEAAMTQIVRHADSLVESLLAQDQYDEALALVEDVTVPAARRISNTELAAKIARQRAAIKRLREAYSEVDRARTALETDPDDPDAQFALGRWHCLEKGDWQQGLPHLARGGDNPLAGLAARDEKGPSSPDEQLALADAWWELAEKSDYRQHEAAATRLRQRAAHWYEQALPQISGILREKAQTRLAESGVASTAVPQYALAFDGVKSYALVDFGYAGTCPITLEVIARSGEVPKLGTVIGNVDKAQRTGLSLSNVGRTWIFQMAEAGPRSERPVAPPPVRLAGHSASKALTEWCHVAAVYDGKQARLFVDGKLQETRVVTSAHRPTTTIPFILGASLDQAGPGGLLLESYFQGQIRAVRVSNVARYTDDFPPPSQLVRDDAATQLLLVFNKSSGDSVPDTSGLKAAGSGSKRSSSLVARLFNTLWTEDRPPTPVK